MDNNINWSVVFFYPVWGLISKDILGIVAYYSSFGLLIFAKIFSGDNFAWLGYYLLILFIPSKIISLIVVYSKANKILNLDIKIKQFYYQHLFAINIASILFGIIFLVLEFYMFVMLLFYFTPGT